LAQCQVSTGGNCLILHFLALGEGKNCALFAVLEREWNYNQLTGGSNEFCLQRKNSSFYAAALLSIYPPTSPCSCSIPFEVLKGHLDSHKLLVIEGVCASPL
jgi:hypothetical protein